MSYKTNILKIFRLQLGDQFIYFLNVIRYFLCKVFNFIAACVIINIIRVTWIGNAYRLIYPTLSTVEVRGLVGELVYNQLSRIICHYTCLLQFNKLSDSESHAATLLQRPTQAFCYKVRHYMQFLAPCLYPYFSCHRN